MFSLTTILLSAVLLLLAALVCYAASILLLALIEAFRGGKPGSPRVEHREKVAVCIPAFDEGIGLASLVRTLVEQDYSGLIEISVLVGDRNDSGYRALIEQFDSRSFSARSDKEHRLLCEESRVLTVIFTRLRSKREKLNHILPRLEASYIAFIDADHRAAPDWISSSVGLLEGSGVSAVQSKRAPLSLRKLPQLWDSAQNHVGNELFNRILSSRGASVFFTGTTCVFRKEVLEGKTFSECITEDTFLSYELLLEGRRIAYNAASGSREEVAPGLADYLARRRRWSSGHNRVLFTFFGRILTAPISIGRRLTLLYHSLFYAVPVAVVLLLNFVSLHLLLQLTYPLRGLACGVSAVLAFVLSFVLARRYRNLVFDSLVAFLWVLPLITLLLPYLLHALDSELYFYLLTFPYARELLYVHLFCLAAPLGLLLLGWKRIGVIHLGQAVTLFLTYPVFLFLDIYACLLGFVDCLRGKSVWARIDRSFGDDELTEAKRFSALRFVAKTGTALAALAFVLVLLNDLTARSNCGEPETALFAPQLFHPDDGVSWKLSVSQSGESAGEVSTTFESELERSSGGAVRMEHYIDGKAVSTSDIADATATERFTSKFPAGWDSHRYAVVLRGNGLFCERKAQFTTVLKTIAEKRLFVNQEPFLIKGVIPSFSNAYTSLDVGTGFRQIKSLGANAVRIYHAPTAQFEEQARAHQLLLVDQPNRSTWQDVDLYSNYQSDKLEERFDQLYRSSEGNPYSLLHLVGNELELMRGNDVIKRTYELLTRVAARNYPNPISYSTYFVFQNYPVPILGINMLDSGYTYWNDALSLLSRFQKPIFATEFGGFVAFFERTPDPLRAHRLVAYWDRLMHSQAIGAMLFQSHDNWAQPVPEGYNDPASPEQPDDNRGLWDRENRPKFLTQIVEGIFSDLEIGSAVPAIENRSIGLELRNRRPYNLSSVRIRSEGVEEVSSPIDFAPGEAKTVDIPLRAGQDAQKLRATYTTHRGLKMESVLNVRGLGSPLRPVVLNQDYIEEFADAERIKGSLFHSTNLDVVFPLSWQKAQLFGETFEIPTRRMTLALPRIISEVGDFEVSGDGRSWRTVDQPIVDSGNYYFRFRAPKAEGRTSFLLISGVGSERVEFRSGSSGSPVQWSVHKYRENIIPLSEISAPVGDDYFYLHVDRDRTVYITPSDNPFHHPILIPFQTPQVFAPAVIELIRQR